MLQPGEVRHCVRDVGIEFKPHHATPSRSSNRIRSAVWTFRKRQRLMWGAQEGHVSAVHQSLQAPHLRWAANPRPCTRSRPTRRSHKDISRSCPGDTDSTPSLDLAAPTPVRRPPQYHTSPPSFQEPWVSESSSQRTRPRTSPARRCSTSMSRPAPMVRAC